MLKAVDHLIKHFFQLYNTERSQSVKQMLRKRVETRYGNQKQEVVDEIEWKCMNDSGKGDK